MEGQHKGKIMAGFVQGNGQEMLKVKEILLSTLCFFWFPNDGLVDWVAEFPPVLRHIFALNTALISAARLKPPSAFIY